MSQTITVPPGGAAVTEFRAELPGRYVLVDHALSRMERGLKGLIEVEGPARPDVYHSHQTDDDPAASGH